MKLNLKYNILKFILGIVTLENLKFKNIVINTHELINYSSSIWQINDRMLLQLSINLFFGMNFIHNQELSLNGCFDLKDIYYQVNYILFFFIKL